ncbi:helix-turn-helix domain-containing protein [Burkholderia sp. JP2-270]|uniref:winged helix-turn-helix transcriptional regulator n=1 Tax=Burkholderia sp. JP2-270 TaxID=2217913 RepID=UPI001EF8FB85|nr:helix-turn-helix domain-containing protein [Burkholderia sp. JP2-270]
MRFSTLKLKREIGDISQRVLSQALRRLERDCLVSRTAYATVPPRVGYAATSHGFPWPASIQIGGSPFAVDAPAGNAKDRSVQPGRPFAFRHVDACANRFNRGTRAAPAAS